MAVKHSTVVGIPDDGTSAVGTNEWNANHTIDNDTITTATIANDAVTYAKIQNVSAASKLLGRGASSGAGDPEEITLGSGLTMTGTTLAATSSGSPGGASLTIQYNNASAFGGMSGTSWDDTNRSLTITGATVTTSKPVFDMTQTWNAGGVTFRGYGLKVTSTASAAASKVLDFQVDNGTNSGTFLSASTDGAVVINQVGQAISSQALLVSFQGTTAFTVSGTQSVVSRAFGFGNGSHTDIINVDGGSASIYSPALKVVGFGDSAANTNGWIQWGGQARVTADFSKTTDTTLANVTGLSVTLQAGRTYSFEAVLFCATGASAGGVKVDLGGTATVTDLIADAIAIDGTTTIAGTRVSALTTAIVANTNAGTTPKIVINGTITVNAAGTLTVRFAQNASSGTASTVKRGSYFLVHDMP